MGGTERGRGRKRQKSVTVESWATYSLFLVLFPVITIKSSEIRLPYLQNASPFYISFVVCVCVCVCVCAYSCPWRPEEGPDLLELKLWVAVSFPVWELGIKLRLPIRATLLSHVSSPTLLSFNMKDVDTPWVGSVYIMHSAYRRGW